MEQGLSEMFSGLGKKEISNIIHHTASETGKTYGSVKNVFTGRLNSPSILPVLIKYLNNPPPVPKRVKAPSTPSPRTRRRITQCICQMCEANGKDPYYTRFIFWTGTLPAKIRCPRCARSVGLKDYEEVHDYE